MMSANVVYMDYNATTPLDDQVSDEIAKCLKHSWQNPSSNYPSGRAAADLIKKSRIQIANMLGASPGEIVFTSGGTECNTWVLQNAVKNFHTIHSITQPQPHSDIDSIPHIITSNVEHPSINLPLKKMKQEGKIEYTCVPVNKATGVIEAGDVITAIRLNTCLVTAMLANNETGIIHPVSKICQSVKHLNKQRSHPIFLHTDAAQAIGKISVDVNELNVDYLTVVGHKFYGPRIGALYARQLGEIDGAPIHPLFYGGGQERGFRAGTENTCMIVGLGKACEIVSGHLEKMQRHMETIRDYLEEQIKAQITTHTVHFNGSHAERLPNTCNVSIECDDLTGSRLLAAMKQTQASVGAACHSNVDALSRPSAVLLNTGIPEHIAMNAIRFSVGRQTTKQDVDIVVQELANAVALLAAS